MGWIESFCVAGMLIFTSSLALDGYILQRDRYWARIWENTGKPEVKSIKELKAYIESEKI